MIGNVRNMILQAKAIYHFRSVIVFAFAVLNVALTVVLVRQHGMLGAALATGLGLLLGYLATAGILQWKAGLNMIRYAQEVAHGILPAMLLCALVGVALPLQPAQTWLVLLAKVVTYTALYVVSMWWIGMNAYEKDLARGFVAKLLKRAK